MILKSYNSGVYPAKNSLGIYIMLNMRETEVVQELYVMKRKADLQYDTLQRYLFHITEHELK